MVGDWSPDPPREVDDHLTNSSHTVVFGSDDSDEEPNTSPPVGYELLFAPGTGLTSDEEEESDNSEDDNNEEQENDEVDQVAGPSATTSSTIPLDVTEHLTQARRSEVDEIAVLYAPGALRPDISVNCDEVRAAMSGFTLPPSSIPPWAENIPEAQWAATLMQQLQRLLTKEDDSSKPNA